MKKTLLSALTVALLLLAASAAGAQQMVVELDPLTYDRLTGQEAADVGDVGDVADIDIRACDLLHEIYPDYCTVWHVVAVIELRGANQHRGLSLENALGVTRDFGIDRVAPQYHLDTGAIFEPQGDWNANNAAGEQWSQLRPMSRRALTVAHWADSNRDGLVSAGDKVVFTDGSAHRLIDVRIGMTLSPVAP